MTKKNFIALADSIREHDKKAASENRLDQVFSVGQLYTLADFCKEQNPVFNRELWLGYVRGEVGKNGGKI